MFLIAGAKGYAGNGGNRTLVVALDLDAYRVHELYELEDLVTAAASSRADRVDMETVDGGLAIDVRDLNQDQTLSDEIAEKAKQLGASVQTAPAKSFWIDYSPSALKSFSPEQLQNDAKRLEGIVDALRTPLPGVIITKDTDGTLVQSDDPAFEKVLRKYLHPFIITPVTERSWHVSWDTNLWPPSWSPARRLDTVAKTSDEVSQLLGDPLDLQIYSSEKGANFIVGEPEEHRQFISAVESSFQRNPAFELRETTSLKILLSASQSASPRDNTISGKEPGLPSDKNLEFMGEMMSLVSPPANIRVDGNTILVRAKNPKQDSELSAVVRTGLSGRHDLLIANLADGALRVSFAPNTHLTSPSPPPSQSQLLEATRSRLASSHIEPLKIFPSDQSHILVTFKSESDARSFRALLSSSGLTFRQVEETSPRGGSPAIPPSPDDEMLKLPTGETIWVKPEPIITGNMLEDASVGEDNYTHNAVLEFRLTDEGRERFAAMTRALVGQRFAILVDGIALEAPVVREPILGGSGVISGNFTHDKVQALVNSIIPHKADLPLMIETAGSIAPNARP
jgi:hypothetical protein